MNCPSCGKNFERVHPDRNLCTCSTMFSGEGTIIEIRTGKAIRSVLKNGERRKFNRVKNKPGSALQTLIPQWSLKQNASCSCKSYAKKMDGWGTQGCEEKKPEIVQHLMDQQKELIGILKVIPASVKRKTAEQLVDKAITLSKEN